MDGMNDECASLHSLIDESKKELNAVKENLKSMSSGVETIQSSTDSLRSDLSATQQMVGDVQTDVSSLRETALSTDATIASLQSDLSSVRDRMSLMTTDVDAVKNGSVPLDSLESLRSEVAAVSRSLSAVESDVESIQSDLSALQNDAAPLSELRSALADLESLRKEQSASAIALRAELDTLRPNVMLAVQTANEAKNSELAHRSAPANSAATPSKRELDVVTASIQRVQESVTRVVSEQALLRQSLTRGDESVRSFVEQVRQDLQQSQQQLQEAWERQRQAALADLQSLRETTGGSTTKEATSDATSEVRSLAEEQAVMATLLQSLQESVVSLRNDLNQVSVKQVDVSSRMSLLTDDWDSRQQALLSELSVVKELFANLTERPDEKTSKWSRRGKSDEEMEMLRMSLEVLREDEKSLKERVVQNSESTADRFAQLRKQMEAVRCQVVDGASAQADALKAAESRQMAALETLRKEMEGCGGSGAQLWRTDVQKAVEEWGVAVQRRLQAAMDGKTEAIELVKKQVGEESEELRGEMDLAIATARSEIMEILNVMMQSLRTADPETVCTIESLIESCKIPQCYSLLLQLETRVQGLEKRV